MYRNFLSLGLIALSSSLLLETTTRPLMATPTGSVSQPSPATLYLAQSRPSYKIRLGDTLSGIASRYKTSVSQILALNPSLRANPNLIRVGQVLALPGGATPRPNASQRRTTSTSRRRTTTRRTTAVKPPTRTTAARSSRRSTLAFRNLPTTRRAGNRTVGARRGSNCFKQVNDQVKALLPNTNFGYTLLDHPSFFWYMPELASTNIPVKFSLRQVEEAENGQEKLSSVIYQEKLTTPAAGIASFSLPAAAAQLEEEQEYEWEVKIECSEYDWITVKGRIERLSSDNPELEAQLVEAKVEEYPAIYASEGIWYDAIALLAALRTEKPEDIKLAEDWGEIMETIGFADLAQVPLLTSSSSSQ